MGAFFGAALVWLRGLIGLSVLVVALALLAGRPLETAASVIAERPWPSLGLGFAALALAGPAAVLIVLIGLVIGGWWLAAVLLAVVWLLALAGFVVGEMELGRLIARRAWPDRVVAAYQAGLLGLVVIWVIAVVPFVGWLALPAATLLGTGAIVLATWWPSAATQGEAPAGGEPAAG